MDAASEPFSLDNERPAHTVDVGPFWIGRVPVSEPYDDDPRWADIPEHHLVGVAGGVVTVTDLEA